MKTEYRPKTLAMLRDFWSMASKYPYALSGVTVKPEVLLSFLADLEHCEACLAEATNELRRQAAQSSNET